ncbi:hypothetical protein BGZ63DRAFT_405118 [Mariannaea sp. PMI_226]|nr:hypothetical protein BGZ63DRAFT_405118 [Mariannaea sp. PMI_226]
MINLAQTNEAMVKGVTSAMSLARDAAKKFHEFEGSLDPNIRDLGTYLFGNIQRTQLAGLFLDRVGNSLNPQEPYRNDHGWANVPHYREVTMNGERQKVLQKDTLFDPVHHITIEKSELKDCIGPLAHVSAFVVNLPSIKASPYPGSWAIKNWKKFMNGGRRGVALLLGKKTPMDAEARLDHLLIHELTHTQTVVPKCTHTDPDQCPMDTIPISVSDGGGSRDIAAGWVLSEMKAYFWPNCVAKANNQGWDNGVYNADNLAYAAIGVQQIKQGNRVEKSGRLTRIASKMARIRQFFGL